MIDLTLRQLLVRTKENQRVVLEIHDRDVEDIMFIRADCNTLNLYMISRLLDAAVSEVYSYGDAMYIRAIIPKTPWLEDEEKDEEDEDE